MNKTLDKTLRVKTLQNNLVPDNEYTRNALKTIMDKGAVINFELNSKPERELLGVYQKGNKYYRRDSLYYVVPPATIKITDRFGGGNKSWGIIDGLVRHCGFSLIQSADHTKHYANTENTEIDAGTYQKLLKSGGKHLKIVLKKK